MKKAVFLDRDGVINDNRELVNKVKDLKIYPWVYDAIRLFNQNGYMVFIITNQGGIELGYLTEQDLYEIHNKLLKCMENNRVIIDDIEYCPHFNKPCDCRKPKPGMILKLAKKYNINLSESWVVGDSDNDMMAGLKAGCKVIKVKNNDIINHSQISTLTAARIIVNYKGDSNGY